MKRMLKAIWARILLVFAHSGSLAEESVNDGICNFSGQGRDSYGR